MFQIECSGRWLNTSPKSTETRDELSITLYLQSDSKKEFCQDACQCLVLYPYITASYAIPTATHSLIITIIIIIIIIYISVKKITLNEDLGLLTKVQKQERGDFCFWKSFWEG